MNEYVTKQEARTALLQRAWKPNEWHDIKSLISSIPPADVRPVRRGRWIPFTSEAAGDIWYCSACGIGFAHHMDFCPHCGADMRGGDADGDTKD